MCVSCPEQRNKEDVTRSGRQTLLTMQQRYQGEVLSMYSLICTLNMSTVVSAKRFIVSSHHQSGSMQEKHQRNFVANLHHQKHGTTNIIRGRFIMHSEGIFHLNHLFWIECRTKVVKLQLVPPSTKSAHSKVADLSHKSSPPR